MQGPQCLREDIPDRAFGDCCDVHRMIIIHLDHSVRNMEKSSGASGNQDSGDPCLFIEIPRTFQKWSDGLLFPADHPLHEGITDHKVGGRGILVKEKDFTSGLHTSTIPAACEVLPLASSVEKQRVSFYLEDR